MTVKSQTLSTEAANLFDSYLKKNIFAKLSAKFDSYNTTAAISF